MKNTPATRFSLVVCCIVLAATHALASDPQEDAGCTLVVRPLTESGNAPPPGLIVWVAPSEGLPRSHTLTALQPEARFAEIPCGPVSYAVFLPIPDLIEKSRLLVQGSFERLRRETLVEPTIPELFRLEIEVVTTSGEPVESRVSVFTPKGQANADFLASKRTNESGRAAFVVPRTSVLVAVSEPRRFVQAEVNGRSMQRPVIFDAHADSVVRFLLHPPEGEGVPVQGRLVDGTGRPIEGLMVEFQGTEDSVNASTGADGTFEVMISPLDAPWTVDLRDDSGCWRLARPVQFPEVPREVVPLTALPTRPQVSGTVVDEEGGPIPGAWVALEGCVGDDEFRHDSHAGQAGAFELGCRAGCSMVIEVMEDGLLDHKRVLDPSACGGSPLTIRMKRGARITGRLTTENGIPATGVVLGADGPGTDESDTVEPDGTYELTSLAPGRLRLQMFDLSNQYKDHSLMMRDPTGELVAPEITVEYACEMERDLVAIEGGAVCFDMPQFDGVSSLDFTLIQWTGLFALLFDDETDPRAASRSLLEFDAERAVACVRAVRPGLVRLLLLDNTEEPRVAPAWTSDHDEPGILEVEVKPGAQHAVDLVWQALAGVAFRLPSPDLDIQGVLARSQDESGEWSPWTPVPLQRLLKFDSEVAQWRVQRRAGLEKTVDHTLILAPGRFQLWIEGIGAEEVERSWLSTPVELKPDAIAVTEFTELSGREVQDAP